MVDFIKKPIVWIGGLIVAATVGLTLWVIKTLKKTVE